MKLLFLEKTKDPQFKKEFRREMKKYHDMLISISKISQIFAKQKIEYAVYKTIRPYRSATVDVDIIIFGGDENYRHSYEILPRDYYKLIVQGPTSTTVIDKKTKIGIDLYQEIAVSNIIYIDKNKLTNYVETIKIPTGITIKKLKPEADLLCVIAHSIIKEQMYTLSEYYTFIHYAKKLDLDAFLKLAKQNNLLNAVRTHTTITALLHNIAFGIVPQKLEELLCCLGEDRFEASRFVRKGLETPYKYHIISVARSLTEIIKGEKTRQSVAVQLYRMLNPKFSKDFVSKMVNHIIRETY